MMAVVVFFPLLYNFYLAFRNMSLPTSRTTAFVGLAPVPRAVRASPAFYTLLGKSLVWTVVNLFFHVALRRAARALLLQRRRCAASAIYRTLLILPWAMPQYISALTWRGMFNYEYGAVNLHAQAVAAPARDPVADRPVLGVRRADPVSTSGSGSRS